MFLRDAGERTAGCAGLWCVNVGYGHDSIVKAAADQMGRLPYATGYFHFGSEPPSGWRPAWPNWRRRV